MKTLDEKDLSLTLQIALLLYILNELEKRPALMQLQELRIKNALY